MTPSMAGIVEDGTIRLYLLIKWTLLPIRLYEYEQNRTARWNQEEPCPEIGRYNREDSLQGSGKI